jgi:Cu-processing system permease protein
VYVVATSAALLALVALISGYVPPRPLQAIGLMLWSSLVLLAISLFGSTFMPTLANSVVVFLMFGLSWLGGFVEAIGTTLESEPMVTLGIVASLIIPSDALWRGASYYLQPVSLIVMQSSSRGGGTIFSSATPPAPAMLVWSAVYLVGMIVAAVVTFDRRDL